jgi:hypothetical protein
LSGRRRGERRAHAEADGREARDEVLQLAAFL